MRLCSNHPADHVCHRDDGDNQSGICSGTPVHCSIQCNQQVTCIFHGQERQNTTDFFSNLTESLKKHYLVRYQLVVTL